MDILPKSYTHTHIHIHSEAEKIIINARFILT